MAKDKRAMDEGKRRRDGLMVADGRVGSAGNRTEFTDALILIFELNFQSASDVPPDTLFITVYRCCEWSPTSHRSFYLMCLGVMFLES